MKIELVENGFIEFPKNDHIQKVVCKYDGTCTVYNAAGFSQNMSVECSVYNRRIGFPISNDGRMLFTSSWENGLVAYDIATNAVVWRLKSSKIKKLAVYATYIIAEKYGKSIIKLDIQTGKVLSEIKSGTISRLWEVHAPYVLVERIKGKLAVVNTEDMTVKKTYKDTVVNPNQCLSLLIQGCQFQDGVLSIYGIESYPNRDSSIDIETHFDRVIDRDFFDTL